MSSKIKRLPHIFISALSRRSVIIPLVCIITILCIAASLSSGNTFIVYDGDNVSVLNSSLTLCSEALNEMGISFDSNDYVEMPDGPVKGVAKIIIQRKKAVSVNDGGAATVLYATDEESISEFLSNNNITLSEHDIISTPASSVITDGMTLNITRVSYSEVEETKDVSFNTVRRANASMEQGTEKTVQKGVNGKKKLLYNVRAENGNAVSKELLRETVINEPVDKIVEYGTKKVVRSGVVTTFSGQKLRYKNVMDVTATAYTTERTSDKITATGQVARVGLVAVDPKVIPLGTKMYIVSADGKSWSYGTAVAADTGVKGKKVDLFYNTYHECISFGRRKAKVYILE